jgi:hypothetical protein
MVLRIIEPDKPPKWPTRHARGQHAARRPTGLERVVTWDCRWASGDRRAGGHPQLRSIKRLLITDQGNGGGHCQEQGDRPDLREDLRECIAFEQNAPDDAQKMRKREEFP